jgi:hypothetical protein
MKDRYPKHLQFPRKPPLPDELLESLGGGQRKKSGGRPVDFDRPTIIKYAVFFADQVVAIEELPNTPEAHSFSAKLRVIIDAWLKSQEQTPTE